MSLLYRSGINELVLCSVKIEEFDVDSQSTSVLGLRQIQEIRIETYGSSIRRGAEKDVWDFNEPTIDNKRGVLHLLKRNRRISAKSVTNTSRTLCILALPEMMTTDDLKLFVEPYVQDIAEMIIVKGGHYMAVLKFRYREGIENFYLSLNGVPFAGKADLYGCNLVFVSDFSIGHDGSIPEGYRELPICAVCLERMDETVDGIVTTVVEKDEKGMSCIGWGDVACPVCYPDSKCFSCSGTDSLWVCLICGSTGCGRYSQGHATGHKEITGHTLSMEISSGRVWDYTEDRFVHRLAEAKNLPNSAEKKYDLFEPAYMLCAHLETQRDYYEQQMCVYENVLKTEIAHLGHLNSAMSIENKRLLQRADKMRTDISKIKHHLSNVEDQVKMKTKLLEEERLITHVITDNVEHYKTKCDWLKEQISDNNSHQDNEISQLRSKLNKLLLSLDNQNSDEASGGK